MKKIILLSVFLFVQSFFAQSLSLTSNITLPEQVGNCGNGYTTNITINGDLNLNGYTITLRNVDLKVAGNLNGNGSIQKCGNYDHSSICVAGSVQNNPNLNNISCNTLSNQHFEITKDYGYKFEIYDLTGRLIKKGITSNVMYEMLPNRTIFIVKVEGFKSFKICL